MEPFEDDRFIAALESLRPAPTPAFAAKLDERAGAGFPRPAPETSLLSRLTAWLESIQLRRALVPAGATALAAIAAVTAIVAVSEPGNSSHSMLSLDSPKAGGTAGAEYTAAPPTKQAAVPSEATSASSAAGLARDPGTGPFASQAPHREIERSAEMVLGADPADVGKDAAKVFAIVHAHRGIVLSSSTRDGSAGEAEAQFDLLIPSAKLGDALAAFSAIAEVRSRHETTADITAPTVSVGERLQDSRARIEGLLAQLADADSDAEREAVETELRGERRQTAALRSRLSTLQRRANLSRVSLRIESGAASSPSEGSGDGWGIDDALGDAGHILAIAAGVTVIGLAILAPLALIAVLAWLASRAWIRHRRERALR